MVPIKAIVDGFALGNLSEYSSAKIPKMNSVGTNTKLCINNEPNTASQPFNPPSLHEAGSTITVGAVATVVGPSDGSSGGVEVVSWATCFSFRSGGVTVELQGSLEESSDLISRVEEKERLLE